MMVQASKRTHVAVRQEFDRAQFRGYHLIEVIRASFWITGRGTVFLHHPGFLFFKERSWNVPRTQPSGSLRTTDPSTGVLGTLKCPSKYYSRTITDGLRNVALAIPPGYPAGQGAGAQGLDGPDLRKVRR